jgi:hypothetical protein
MRVYACFSLLHGIDSIFPPPSKLGHKNGKHPISEKRASKGAGSWTINKVSLGWALDGEVRAFFLLPGKVDEYIEYMEAMLHKCVPPTNLIEKPQAG